MSQRELKYEIALDKGLLPAENAKKDDPYLTLCDGAFPYQGVLQTIELDPSVIDEILVGTGQMNADGSIVADGSAVASGGNVLIEGIFPYPQIFICINEKIACLADAIYEVEVNQPPTLMMAGIPIGTPWECVDFQEWVYLTNGRVAIVKDQDSRQYRYAPELPFGTGALNFNGQLIILSPNSPVFLESWTAPLPPVIPQGADHLIDEYGNRIIDEKGDPVIP